MVAKDPLRGHHPPRSKQPIQQMFEKLHMSHNKDDNAVNRLIFAANQSTSKRMGNSETSTVAYLRRKMRVKGTGTERLSLAHVKRANWNPMTQGETL